MTVANLDRIEGALFGTMIGDALGRPFEGTPSADMPQLRAAVERRMQTPRAWGHSDDAEMMLALGDSLVACDGVDEAHLLHTLSSQHDPARGYGKGTRAAFRAWAETRSWQLASRALWPEGSRGNGASVRVAPVAAFYRESDAARVRAAARRTAMPTHCHEEALAGAELMALAIWHALAGTTAVSLASALRSHAIHDNFDERLSHIDPVDDVSESVTKLGNDVFALASVPLAIWAHARNTTFEGAVLDAVSAAGDTDTIGAMTGAIAGATYGAKAMPKAWLAALETPGRRRAEKLAAALLLASMS